jgi:hypothetical protein
MRIFAFVICASVVWAIIADGAKMGWPDIFEKFIVLISDMRLRI